MPSSKATASREAPPGESPGIVEVARQFLELTSRRSPLWVAAIVLLVIASTIDVTRNFEGDVSIHFRVTTVTALIIALTWLPALVHAISLTGGSVKTPAGEASATGFLQLLRLVTPDTRREVLKSMAAGLDSAELAAGSSQTRGEARARRRDIEQELRGSIEWGGSPEAMLDE
ncbi:MAG TPA: hypothetical protein VGV34_05345, partial [Solirubrobacterales bacterium]|nr:hypothetical protein [Solirubrobacterales bacterium]